MDKRMGKDYETRGRPRSKKWDKICTLIEADIEEQGLPQKGRGSAITVDAGKVTGQAHTSFSYMDLKQRLKMRGMAITAYHAKGKNLQFRVRKM